MGRWELQHGIPRQRSPFSHRTSGPRCALSSSAQQARADIFGAVCDQRCPVADALITSSGEQLSGSSSTDTPPMRHRFSEASARTPEARGARGARRSSGEAARAAEGAGAGRRRAAPESRAAPPPPGSSTADSARRAARTGGAGHRAGGAEARRAQSRGHA